MAGISNPTLKACHVGAELAVANLTAVVNGGYGDVGNLHHLPKGDLVDMVVVLLAISFAVSTEVGHEPFMAATQKVGIKTQQVVEGLDG